MRSVCARANRHNQGPRQGLRADGVLYEDWPHGVFSRLEEAGFATRTYSAIPVCHAGSAAAADAETFFVSRTLYAGRFAGVG